jgi:vacuolar protein sorting-associated protein 45
MYNEERSLYDFGQRAGEVPPLLLLIDRRDDPVTPLLLQWTYQAMVHDLLGIRDNRVDLTPKGSKVGAHCGNGPCTGGVQGWCVEESGMGGCVQVHKEASQVVLSASQDKFYKDHMYSNYGDLGMAVKALVDDFQKDAKISSSIQSIQEMMRFVEAFPEFRAKQGSVSKHVTLLSEISSIVDRRCAAREGVVARHGWSA